MHWSESVGFSRNSQRVPVVSSCERYSSNRPTTASLMSQQEVSPPVSLNVDLQADLLADVP